MLKSVVGIQDTAPLKSCTTSGGITNSTSTAAS